jgi:hypothetical protein
MLSAHLQHFLFAQVDHTSGSLAVLTLTFAQMFSRVFSLLSVPLVHPACE